MIRKQFRRIISVVLAIALLVNLLPVHALALSAQAENPTANKEQTETITASGPETQNTTNTDVFIVQELIERRSEYAKEYLMSNGLHMAVMYADAVHYHDGSKWEEIDNTLQLSSTRAGNAYMNTAGIWQISFPQSMTENNGVTISKDGYVFSFRMAGELLDPSIKDIVAASEIIEIPVATDEPTAGEEETVPTTEEVVPTEEPTEVSEETEVVEAAEVPEENATEPTVAEETVETSETEVTEAVAEAELEATEGKTAATDMQEVDASVEEESAETTESQEEAVLEAAAPEAEEQDAEPAADEPAVVSAPKENVVAAIESVDMEKIKAQAEYPETVVEKISSRLTYGGIYEDTDLIFDLNSNQVKESIVLNTYRESLMGYIYALEMGDLTPVLLESGEIELRDADGEEVIMYMPAPYLIDDAGATCFDVKVSLEGENGKYVLAYELPREWLADSNREWPVVLDPAVLADTDVNNIQDATVYTTGRHTYENGVLELGYRSGRGLARSYIKYKDLPKLTSADVIVRAQLSLYKPHNSATVTSTIEVHEVSADWTSQTVNWDTPFKETVVEDYVICKASGYYSWDITEIARNWYNHANYGLLLKYPNTEESITTETWKQFYSSDKVNNQYRPNVIILFRNNNGLEEYWDYTTTSAGRAGTGFVHQYTGNLVWTHSDIGFGGHVMPVSISHIYNANDSAKNEFGLGNGWRTNFNQRVYRWTNSNAVGEYYVWEDADGTAHYFQYKSDNVYKDEDGLELTLTTNGSDTERYCIKDKQGNASYFDTYGRLTEQRDNQRGSDDDNCIKISYRTSNSLLISTITDGVGRKYEFKYDTNKLLVRIKCSNQSGKELGSVNFAYDLAPNLRSITHQDGKTSSYTYAVRIHETDSSPVIANLLSEVTDIDGYMLTFDYHTTAHYYEPARVSSVQEENSDAVGGQMTFEYGQNQTTVTDRSGNVQIVQFNNWGNTTAVYDNQGRAKFAQYASDAPPEATAPTGTASTNNNSSTAKGNQLLASSKLQNTVSNLLQDSSFEYASNWQVNSGSVSCSVSSEAAYLGNHSLKLVRPSAGDQAGVYRDGFAASAGETYTFSAYVKTSSARAYLVFWDGSRQVTSDILPANSDWTRLEVSYTATSAATTYPYLLTPDAGTVYMDCVQVEKAPAASRYNLIQNGDFRSGSYWSSAEGRVCDDSAVPQLDNTVYQIAGSPTLVKRIYQDVPVTGSKGDSYVFGGWASADSVPLDTSDTNPREFAIIATFTYSDGTTGTQKARFNPHVNNWQYAATFIQAEKAYTSLRIELAYDYNANVASFDGIQLFKEEFGNQYTYDSSGNVDIYIDALGQPTKYTYWDNGVDLKTVAVYDESYLTDDSVAPKLTTTYTYDEHHNVLTSTSSTGVSYSYTYDSFGNRESETVTGGDMTQTTRADYSDDGNLLESTTDAAGQTTRYKYDPDTNVLKSVQYPVDTDTSKTQYEYDELCRLTNISVTIDKNNHLSAKYTYENDNLTELKTAKTTYDFAYDAPFSQISKISIGSFTLAQYQYSSTTEAPGQVLSRLDYGNGDKVQYTYDKQGRVTAQTYEDGDTVTYRYDNDGELASVTDSATGLSTKYIYDFTGRTAAVERRNGDTIILRTEQSHNSDNQPIKQVTEFANGANYTYSYTYNADMTPQGMVSGVVGTGFVYDALMRISRVNSEIGVLTRTYGYRTDPHTSQVTALNYVSLKGGYSFKYTYDSMGNIEKYHLDCVNNNYDEAEFTYDYDSQNQLVEATDGTVTYSYTYDNAGNISTANGHTYTYGNSDWGDLLMAYDGQPISYDGIGNPISYYNGTSWNFTWEHGRQLAAASGGGNNVTYTYDADGLRTSKTVNGVVYTYYYVGSQLARMTYGDYVLDFFYDINGTPIAMRQGYASSNNYTVYYYITNLQGDVIRLVDVNGSTAAYYEYDPYGNAIKASGSHANINPLRYRGYVYDSESGLYYLQSRYYDPKIGRFLNADALTSTGQGLLGNNMFAYCNNNSVTYADPEGNLPGGIINPNAMARNSGGSLHPISDKDQAKQRINTNENAVLKAEQYAYYKGVLYLKVPGDSAFSFGIVFFGSEIDDANLVRHEYGHTRQLAKLGNSDYLRYVVLPSVTCFWLTEWDKIPSSIYHYLPWEYIANRYGGIPGYNSGKYDMIANTYWDNVRILSFVS